ncbi:MAG TPA: tetratricopeptide repeat protein, partial [Bacteroidales bacterium]
WNKANQFFADQVKKNPADPSLKFYLGETFLALGKADSAENNFNKGIDYAFSTAGLGKIILSKGDTTKAKESFNKAIKEERKNGDLYAYIVEACISGGYAKLAEQFYLRGKEVTTKNANLYMAAGDLAKLRGNAGEAANAYENAVFYDKNMALAYVKVGNIYTDSRSWDVAAQNFNKALAIDPQYPLAFKGLGDMYFKSGKFQDASDNYKKFFDNSEVSLEDKYRYAFILFYNKEYAEATKMIESLLKIDSKNPVLLRLQAYISYELGVDEKGKVTKPESITTAMDNITKFFKVQDRSKLLSSDYEYLAKIEIASKLDSLAPDNYMKAYLMDSTRTSLLEDGAKIASRIGLYLKAVPFYQTMIRLSPENAAINSFRLGQQYYLQAFKKDTAKADSLLKQQHLILADTAFKTVATLIPANILGPLWMARTENLLDTKGEDKAQPYYEKVIQLITGANEADKRKNEIVEAYRYMGALWYTRAYNALNKKKDKAEYQEDKTKSLDAWNKILELIPTDTQAKEAQKAFEDLDKVKNRPQPQAQPQN